ncbi:MAG: hypothetical protein AB7E51_15160 [Pseudodesulfovibrio sp.]|uniref:hypothetical protein n=1 Tax=Pseudodesulfovibrio sp. TaxID=2035812 RepID=UPI003D1163C2
MTIVAQTTRIQYVGAEDPAEEYPVTFKFMAKEDLAIVHTDEDETDTILVLDTDYTVIGAGEDEGGTVTITNSDYLPSTGQRLTIYLDMEINQEVLDVLNGTAFMPEVIETSDDRIVLLIQQLSDAISRCLQYGASSSDDDIDSNISTIVALKAVAVNAAEEAQESAENATTASGIATSAASEAQAARDIIPAAENILLVSNNLADLDDPDTARDNIGAEPADEDILKRDESSILTAGFPASPKPMATTGPTPATGALQTIDTSGGAVSLAAPSQAGVIRFIVSGSNALTPSASYDSIDGAYDTDVGLAQGEIVSDGTHHFITIVNGVSA